MDTDFQKRIDERDYRRGILEALLYSSTTEDNFMFPTDKVLIYSEIIRATVEYASGKEDMEEYGTRCSMGGRIFDRSFERKMWDYFKLELGKSYGELDETMKDTLLKLLEPKWRSDIMGDGSYVSELYNGWDEICKVFPGKEFSLSQEVLYRVKRKVLPSLPERVIEDVQGIGKLMRKYIDRDLQ